MLLTIESLSARYGSVTAVRDSSITVNEGELVALLGPNGAGKTTTLSCVMGTVPAAAGAVRFDGRDITSLSPEDTVRAGVVLCPEGRRILGTLTVRENLELGAAFRKDRRQVSQDLDKVLERFPILATRAGQSAGTLSGGEAQQLAFARALLAKPRVLMLDEPTLGLAPQLVDQVFAVIDELRQEGLTILLVDQNATRCLEAADRTYVMRQGSIVVEGTAEQVGGAAGLAAAYLGPAAEAEVGQAS